MCYFLYMSTGVGSHLIDKDADVARAILDHAARIGTAARREDVEKSQLEQLSASLEGYPHERLCLLVTAVFARRQEQRGYLRRDTARAVLTALHELYNKGGGKEDARVLLSLSKWVYEAVSNIRVNRPVSNFDELIKVLMG